MDEAYAAEVAHEIAHPRRSIAGALAALGLRAGERLIDVGCGGGAHLGLFARAVAPGGHVVGLDRNAERLALAASLHVDAIAVGAVALRQGDHDSLPAAAGEFDVAWASLVLHHAARPGDFLRELARVTRPGGRVAILDGDGGGSFPVLPWPPELEQRLRAAGWAATEAKYDDTLPYHFSGYTGRNLPRLLRAAGLADVALHPLADSDRAPLDPQREREIRDWFIGPFAGRLRDFLAPRDLAWLNRLFDPAAADYLLASPDFFLARTWFLGIGWVG